MNASIWGVIHLSLWQNSWRRISMRQSATSRGTAWPVRLASTMYRGRKVSPSPRSTSRQSRAASPNSQIGPQGQFAGGQQMFQGLAVAHAPLGEQKLLPGQVGQREPLPPGQRMSRRREETAGFGLVQQADKGRGG